MTCAMLTYLLQVNLLHMALRHTLMRRALLIIYEYKLLKGRLYICPAEIIFKAGLYSN